MRRVLMTLLALASVPAIAAEDPKYPPDVQARIDEANAKKAEAEAKAAEYKAEAEAAAARFSALPKSPAKGETTLNQGAGKLETNLLVASTYREAARIIATDPGIQKKGDHPILLLPGTAALDRSQTMAFHAQAVGLKSAFSSAMPNVKFQCGGVRSSGVDIQMVPPDTIMAGLGAVADLLKTDITISAIDSDLGEASLVRAVAAARPTEFTTTFKVPDLDNNSVALTLCELQDARLKAEVALRLLGPEPQKEHPREAAALTQVTQAYDTFLGKLTTPSTDKPAPLALIMAEAVIETYPGRILRVWADAKGGTVIVRKNFWTLLGARSLGMTGGSVVSYMLTDKDDGNVYAAGFLHCNTKLVSLRDAHKDAFAEGFCEKVANFDGIPAAANGANGRR